MYQSALTTRQSLVPIIVGHTSLKTGEAYGKVFAPYFQAPGTLFIISSDFCHWGEHFDFQPKQEGAPIWQTIEKLDKAGMELIEKNDIGGFDSYIKSTQNTICGEHPIRVLMNTVRQSKLGASTQFVKYAQSEKVVSEAESSVSYASAITFLVN